MENQIARLRILEATRLRIQLEKKLQNLRAEDLAEIVTSYVHDSGIAHNLIKDILLSQYEGTNLLADDAWRSNFIATVRVQAMLRFRELDSLSMLGAMNAKPSNVRPMNFKHLSDNVWLTQMKSGMFSLITGKPGTGKTDISILLAGIALRNNITVISNITSKDQRIKTTPKASELIRSLVIDDQPKFVILDEMGISWARKQAMSGRNIALEKLARIIRKFKCSLLVIIQERNAIPPLISSFSTMKIHKTSTRRAHLALNNPECQLDCIINRIQKAQIDYDTNDIAALDLDLDIDEIFSAAATGKDSFSQRESIIKHLDKPPKPTRAQIMSEKKERAKELLAEGLAQGRIAKIVGLSPATVNKLAKLS